MNSDSLMKATQRLAKNVGENEVGSPSTMYGILMIQTMTYTCILRELETLNKSLAPKAPSEYDPSSSPDIQPPHIFDPFEDPSDV